jgi:hypothetical protein
MQYIPNALVFGGSALRKVKKVPELGDFNQRSQRRIKTGNSPASSIPGHWAHFKLTPALLT